jgi:hypothetical protein
MQQSYEANDNNNDNNNDNYNNDNNNNNDNFQSISYNDLNDDYSSESSTLSSSHDSSSSSNLRYKDRTDPGAQTSKLLPSTFNRNFELKRDGRSSSDSRYDDRDRLSWRSKVDDFKLDSRQRHYQSTSIPNQSNYRNSYDRNREYINNHSGTERHSNPNSNKARINRNNFKIKEEQQQAASSSAISESSRWSRDPNRRPPSNKICPQDIICYYRLYGGVKKCQDSFCRRTLYHHDSGPNGKSSQAWTTWTADDVLEDIEKMKDYSKALRESD